MELVSDISSSYELKSGEILLVSLAQFAVGGVSVVYQSFVNSQMAFSGWTPETITYFFGFAVYFEVLRVAAGYFSDKYKNIKTFFLVAFVISLTSIISISYVLSPPNNLLLLLFLILFSIGSAVMSTLIDSYVTMASSPQTRNKVAGVIQFARLSGFAFGGISGFILYPMLDFNTFMSVYFVIYLVFGFGTFIQINNDVVVKSTRSVSFSNIGQLLGKKNVQLILLFLILYPIGLFMQDNILEPFAILSLGFSKEGVGRLSAIWTTLTLIFVPVGIKLGNKFGKKKTIYFGEIFSAMGLVLIGLSSSLKSGSLLYLGLVLFGVGAGIYSVPGIALMFDISNAQFEGISFLLAIFGMVVTISRGTSGIIAGFLLGIFNSYSLVFYLEAFIAVLSILPIYLISNNLQE